MIFAAACIGRRPTEGERYVRIEGQNIRIPNRDTVIDYKVLVPPDKELVLLVKDIDDVVKTYHVEFTQPGKQTRSRPLFHGYASALPNSDALHAIPAKEVPVSLVKATCVADGSERLGVVTLGLTPDAAQDLPHYNLYVIARQGRQYRRIYEKHDAGVNLQKFVFRDLNDDCLPEMIDVSSPGGESVVHVRAVDSRNGVSLKQELAGKAVLMTEPCPDRLEMMIILEDAGKRRPNQFMVWDKKAGRFVESPNTAASVSR